MLHWVRKVKGTAVTHGAPIALPRRGTPTTRLSATFGNQSTLRKVFPSTEPMEMTANTNTGHRKYHRRSDNERIADLERRIADLKSKQAARGKRDDPVLREIPKIQRRLRKFGQLAMDHNRPDIANSVTAFNAGLERILSSEVNRAASRAVPEPQEA